jgi:membrane fusion protein (multidrug efflux system)
METTNEVRTESLTKVRSTHLDAGTTVPEPGSTTVPAPAAPAAKVIHPDEPLATQQKPAAAHPPSRSWRKWLLLAAIMAGVAAGAHILVPVVQTALNTVSTDDAYVNGHVTFIAPRVAGHVAKVLVDNNQRVKQGDILVQLDKEPYRIQVEIMKSALATAKTDLALAMAQARGLVAQTRSSRFKLDHAMEDVRNQIELLKSNVA